MKTLIPAALFAFAAALASAQGKPAILVAPVSSEILDETQRRLVQDAVIDRIVASEGFVVVSEAGRALAMEEIARSLSGFFSEATALDAGRLVEADLVLATSVGRLGDGRVWLAVRMVDVATGRLARAGSREYADLVDIAGRMRDLVGKTLALGTAAAPSGEEGEVLYLPISAHAVLQAISLGASWYNQRAESHDFGAASLALGIYQTYGRPLGFYVNANFLYPIGLELDGTNQEWLGDLGFPWGVDCRAGVVWRMSLGDTVSVDAKGGLGFTEFLFYPPWNADSPEVQAQFPPGELFPGAVWNFGVFLGLAANVRLDASTYLILGCDAAYHFGEFLPGLYDGYGLKDAWSFSPLVCLGQGR